MIHNGEFLLRNESIHLGMLKSSLGLTVNCAILSGPGSRSGTSVVSRGVTPTSVARVLQWEGF